MRSVQDPTLHNLCTRTGPGPAQVEATASFQKLNRDVSQAIEWQERGQLKQFLPVSTCRHAAKRRCIDVGFLRISTNQPHLSSNHHHC